MVGCISKIVVELFPHLKQYMHAATDMLVGVGDIGCKVYGELKNVPISLGPRQVAGTAVAANFKIVEGMSYSILFGLDLLVPLNAKLYLKERVLEISGPKPHTKPTKPAQTFRLNLLPRSVVRN